MNDYNDSSIMNSKLAVQILSEIGSKGNEDYGSNIANKLDKRQSSISRTLTKLEEKGFLNKLDRERAQYYSINYDSIVDYWFKTLCKELKEAEKESGYKVTWNEKLEEQEEKSKEALKLFLRELLRSNKELDGTDMSKLIFDNFVCSVTHKLKDDEKLFEERPELLYPVIATAYVKNDAGFPEIMGKAMNKME